MTRSGPDLSVVICCYTDGRRADLSGAVASVRRQTRPAREIVVVVDYNPALLGWAREAFAARAEADPTGQPEAPVTVVENSEARGLSGARNSGVAAARGQVVAFLDDDAIAEPDWLEQLATGYLDPRVLGVGGTIEPLWLSGRPRWFPDELDWVVGCTYRGVPRETTPVQRLIGANMSFRREVFARAGGFRSGVGQVGDSLLRCDDTEFSIRVHQRCPGAVLLFEPRAKVRHRVPPARAGWSYFRARSHFEGVSKALLSGVVGTRDGLQSERTYVVRTLPWGVARSLADVILKRDWYGLARGGTIVAGLSFTASGYLLTAVRQRQPTRVATSDQARGGVAGAALSRAAASGSER